MLPSSRLFRSRWSALLWSAGILWAAADFARSAPHEGKHTAADQGEQVDAAELNVADLDTLSNTLDP